MIVLKLRLNQITKIVQMSGVFDELLKHTESKMFVDVLPR